MRHSTRVKLARIAAHFSDVDEAIKMLKIAEEYGEVSEAYIGMLGANSRKGVTHGISDVVNELGDVVITAYTALAALTDSPISAIESRVRYVYERLGLPVVGPECDTHERADCAICSASTTRPEAAPKSVSPSGSLPDTATQDGQ